MRQTVLLQTVLGRHGPGEPAQYQTHWMNTKCPAQLLCSRNQSSGSERREFSKPDVESGVRYRTPTAPAARVSDISRSYIEYSSMSVSPSR
jgi:hypothetical protein